jgi:hypothetical protein
VHKLELQAFVLHRETLDPEAFLFFWPTDRIPGEEALGTTDFVLDIPEKRLMKPLHCFQQGRRQVKSPHGKGGKGVKHRVQEDDASTRR